MKARIVLAIGIAIAVIVGLVLVLGTLYGSEPFGGPNSTQNSSPPQPEGKHLQLNLSDSVGIKTK
ncbi:MAG: hypothetical protein E6K91_08200 [Thaumarchaeota archaeon]|nr:MAG: hypothetical protein E6K91_08200 [Nitrososphaerota archaeon]